MSKVIIRKLQKEDLFNGFLESLDSLRKVSDLDEKTAFDIFERIQENPNHVILVAEISNRIVGSTTLFIEQKFIHKGGRVSHIEDVVVSKKNQCSGIGKKLIEAALNYAKNAGCYKTILDCSDEVRPFYEKIGFIQHSNSMRFDHH